MRKIDDAQELERELRRLLAYSQSERPSRTRVANELQTLTGRLAHGKTANLNIKGPYFDIDNHQVAVWFSSTSYGRVHHLTSDLDAAEKRLLKIRGVLLDALNQGGIHVTPGDVVVDGRGADRDALITYFTVRALGGWDEDEMSSLLLRAAKQGGVGFLDFVPLPV